jgi:endonuclease/exonuclease/phosphatase family metal-dependent hydrolase
MLYNIRYGTGGRPLLFPWSGYLRRTHRTLARIAEFTKSQSPDIVGLVEVDAGSYRTGRRNQAKTIADYMGHYHVYRSKYSDTMLAHLVPILNKQGNAFLTRDSITNAKFHYFERGVKRLVIELEMENLVIFLVHLALHFRTRQSQLADLYSLVNGTEKPHLVAGDFNARWGDREIKLFLAATRLANADTFGHPTFPSWAPKRQLDFVLHSPHITVENLIVPSTPFSDHLPLICDFEIQ